MSTDSQFFSDSQFWFFLLKKYLGSKNLLVGYKVIVWTSTFIFLSNIYHKLISFNKIFCAWFQVLSFFYKISIYLVKRRAKMKQHPFWNCDKCFHIVFWWHLLSIKLHVDIKLYLDTPSFHERFFSQGCWNICSIHF